MSTSRREFLQKTSALVTAALAAPPLLAAHKSAPAFGEISLAQWSLHKALFKQELTNLDFPGVARQKFGITTVEYVNQFFKDKAKDQTYLRALQQRCRDNGITNHLIMVDGEGDLGSPDERERQQAVENHRPWLEAAAFLGCRSVRVNAFGKGTAEQVQRAAVAGLGQLSAYAQPLGLNVVVENHGSYTSNGQWLLRTIQGVGKPNVGVLPDFGNFCVRRESGELYKGQCVEEYDRYKAVTEWLPVIKTGVSAKTLDFDAAGNCVETDYYKMLGLLKKAKFQGYLGIEYEGEKLSEEAGIRRTKELIEKVVRSMG
ncbi:sugar phosphate isomerase/epimerase [Hymenobacter sp. BT507]|uniref:Sugar phosphate isomerase/epimerase n=1 Tax=Hymenobacter citatus TaxID=2763506 RepID=A0ABR7MQQ3_9BACT|nr:sugar phosphate isomerase/epimerase family protein [Hymenobacter citatus]MBC6612868.1 sugar phosphate isomerase/epimerase [Hymenobacter citatus]